MKRKISERFLICLMGVLLILTFASFTAHAAVPQTVNYQGYLTDSGGNPVNSTVQMTFSIYNVSTGGAALWTETQSTVPVNSGIYSVVLGSVVPITLPFDAQYYLGVKVGADAEMTPRQALTSVPYSFRANEANNADTVDGQHASVFATSGHNHDATYVNEGQVDSVTNTMIVNGAVTDAKITGPISSGKISSAGLNADMVDGKHAGDLQNRVTGVCAAGSSIRTVNADGTVVCEPDDVGLTVESDPQVGANTLNYVPKWDGNSLTTGSIYDNGNVGIGIMGAGYKLDVNGDINIPVGSQYKIGSVDQAFDKWSAGSGNDIYRLNGNVGIGKIIPTGILDISHDGISSDLVVDSTSGNVGIGTTVPNASLEVVGDTLLGSLVPSDSEMLRIRKDYNYWGLDIDAIIIEKTDDDTSTEGGLVLGFANSPVGNTNPPDPSWATVHQPVMVLRGSGNVGIGTTNPSEKLTVEGSAPFPNSIIKGTNNDSGVGVYGENTSSGYGVGVYGKSSNSEGVRGESISGEGVHGQHSSGNYGFLGSSSKGVGGYSSSGYGVWGSSSSGYAGYFNGNVHITGNLSKGSGSFVQPHPNDPSKELVYAFFEGPEHAVFLRGTAKLINGKAVIETPEYFRVVAGNEGITVQFTPRSSKSKGLAAVEVTKEMVKIEELMEGNGTYEFDYFITAKRGGFEEHQPIAANTHFKPAENETAKEFEARYSKDDITTKAMRSMLISNGILTKEGKLNMARVKELGWTVAENKSPNTSELRAEIIQK